MSMESLPITGERSRHPFRDADIISRGAVSVMIARDADNLTLQWPSSCDVAGSLELMEPIASSARRAWLVSVDRFGRASSTSGDPQLAVDYLKDLTSKPEPVSHVHIDCDVEDAGEVVLSFDRVVLGLNAPDGNLSLTAKAGKFGENCMKAFFNKSAPLPFYGEYERLVGVEDAVREPKPLPEHRNSHWRQLVKSRTYADPEGAVRGQFFELTDEEYIQVEVDTEGAVVLWSSTLPLSSALTRINDVVGEVSHDGDGYLATDNGEIESASAQVLEVARKNPDAVRLLVATYGLASVSWQRERIKLKSGHRPLAEFSLAGRHIDVDLLSRLVDSTATTVVQEAVRSSSVPLTEALGEAAITCQ